MADEIIINEPVAPAAKPEAPTKDALVKQGWSESEIAAAEKHKMVKVEEPKKEEKPAGPATTTNGVVTPEPKPESRASNLPDFTISDPAKEKVFLETFGPGTPQRAMYFRMKHERQERQSAQAERDRIKLEKQLLEDQLAAYRTRTPEPRVDKDGHPIVEEDPDDKPLTMRRIKEIQAEEAKEREAKQRQFQDKAEKVSRALKEQEEMAYELNPDFGTTLNLAGELMTKLDTLITDESTKRRVQKLIRDVKAAAARADEMDPDDLNAAELTEDLARFHPSFGKKPDGGNAEPHNDGKLERPESKANGSLTPEQMKRIEENTQRRASSASIPSGGGRRVVSADDVTIKDVLKMSPDQREAFKKKYPEKMAKFLRG